MINTTHQRELIERGAIKPWSVTGFVEIHESVADSIDDYCDMILAGDDEQIVAQCLGRRDAALIVDLVMEEDQPC